MVGIVGVMFWYIRRLISTLNRVYDLVQDILEAVSLYEEHLEKVYKMDTFYGDSTLEGLLEHSKDLKKGLQRIVQTIQSFFDEATREEGTDAEETREEEFDTEEA
tara:strand:+ start:6233 stop:6547 length:315 start_codon:yes stop_codon:yes gene_type:complete